MLKNIEIKAQVTHPTFNVEDMDFKMKIGGTTYEVCSHFNLEGKQSVLEQFKNLILSENLI